MCTFWALGLSCKTWRQQGVPGEGGLAEEMKKIRKQKMEYMKTRKHEQNQKIKKVTKIKKIKGRVGLGLRGSNPLPHPLLLSHEVIDEARTKGRTVHSASLVDLCHLKNSELEPQYQKVQRLSRTPR